MVIYFMQPSGSKTSARGAGPVSGCHPGWHSPRLYLCALDPGFPQLQNKSVSVCVYLGGAQGWGPNACKLWGGQHKHSHHLLL